MTQAPAHPSSDARRADASPSTRHRWLSVGSEGLRYRLGVAVRAATAIFGGYAVSALAAGVLAIMLPTVRLEAAVASTLLALVVYPCAVMWVFAARSAARALVGLLLPSAVLGGVLLAYFYRGAPA